MGAPLALIAASLGQDWLFYLGLALLVIALALPARADQTLRERLANLLRHLPGVGWLKRKD